MKKKFRTILAEKTKSYGLTDKAIDELVELGCKSLTDDATDEDITAQVDSLVPYAKAMQGEITRKMRKSPKPSIKPSIEEGDDEGEDNNEVPSWFKKQMESVNKSLETLKNENEALKAEKTKSERQNLIAEKAKSLGIPDYLMKRVSFSDDADLDKELAEYKQELVNNNLVQKDETHEIGKTDEALKADAKAWAESLPTN